MKSENEVRNKLAELRKQYTDCCKKNCWTSADLISEQIKAISWVID